MFLDRSHTVHSSDTVQHIFLLTRKAMMLQVFWNIARLGINKWWLSAPFFV